MERAGRDEELGRRLAVYEMSAKLLSVETQVDDDPPKKWPVRLILPPSSPQGLASVVSNGWWERGEREVHGLAVRLLSCMELVSLYGRRTDRIFGHRVLKRQAEFRELRALAKGAREPGEVIRSLFGAQSRSFKELLVEARYKEPLGAVPVDEDGYIRYREMFLGNIESARVAVRQYIDELGIPEQAREAAVGEATSRVLRKLALDATKYEKEEGRRLEPLAARADALLTEAARRYRRNPRAPLRRRFDWDDVCTLLWDSLHTLEGLGSPSAAEQAETVRRTIHKGSIFMKIELLRHIWRSYRDRTPLIENLLVQVDDSVAYVLEQGYRQVYREIRDLLSPAERRLFLLMYSQRLALFGEPPTFPFAGGILWTEPALLGSLDDERVLALTTLVVGYKQAVMDDSNLAEELRERICAYLAFYRYFLVIARDGDRQRRQRSRSTVRQRRVHINMEEVEDQHRRRDSWKLANTDLEAALQSMDMLAIMDYLGVPDRRDTARLRWGEGLTQKEIAARKGISQQAVSKTVRAICEDVERELEARGLAPNGAKKRKRRWSPR